MHFPSTSPRRKLATAAIAGVFVLMLYHSWSLAPRLHYTRHALPTPPSTTFPNKLWYKLGAKGLSDDARNWTATCSQLNPDYKATFLTDATADAWVQQHYADRPDIVSSYLDLAVPILKADLLRYLLLYAEGGVWSDLDVSCEVPIEDWVPQRYKSNTSLLVGWEFDAGWSEGFIHQLSSWMIAARPRLPHMLTAIEDILESLGRVARDNGVGVDGVSLAMVGDVVDFTGPRRLTRSVYKSVRKAMNATEEEFGGLERASWFITEPRLVGDVLVLPGFSFAHATNVYDDAVVVGPPLVKHHYAGTWKNDHGGEE